MSNTIELLETIGKDASLRHAPENELAKTLAGMDASEELQRAVASGDRLPLEEELGRRDMKTTNSPIQTGPGDGGDDDEEDAPEQQSPGDESSQPPE
jgi:hypothetical protein